VNSQIEAYRGKAKECARRTILTKSLRESRRECRSKPLGRTANAHLFFRIFPMYEFLHSQAQKRTHVLQIFARKYMWQ
jgi:hypothetical protein